MFAVETIQLDLPALAGAFSRRLHQAGLPVTAERSAAFAHSLKLVNPITRRRLYWTARAVFISDRSQIRAFDSVFQSVFGTSAQPSAHDSEDAHTLPFPPDRAPHSDRDLRHISDVIDSRASGSPPPSAGDREDRDGGEVLVPTVASEQERLREKRFDALEPDEIAQLYRLMTQLELAAPQRRSRRAQRYRHGRRIDMRRTLRGSMRTAGDPIRLARRRRRVVPRRIVLLCDISGSMEPYARAYLQFLTCATAGGADAEAFVFATRLTRLTRALTTRNPERAIQQAAAAAPDWSSGTRIGDALKAFNDCHGRRGMARGAVVVILSDGWERGDPTLVGREMARLSRLAYRILWVNPRAASSDFVPRAGGMKAALPYCDALLSGHSLQALADVVDAIGQPRSDAGGAWSAIQADEDEEWASATPVRGSSVAMPSGYGPSRGNTTSGWGLGAR